MENTLSAWFCAGGSVDIHWADSSTRKSWICLKLGRKILNSVVPFLYELWSPSTVWLRNFPLELEKCQGVELQTSRESAQGSSREHCSESERREVAGHQLATPLTSGPWPSSCCSQGETLWASFSLAQSSLHGRPEIERPDLTSIMMVPSTSSWQDQQTTWVPIFPPSHPEGH